MVDEPTNDSRTSVVGRKRDLQDASKYREPSNTDDSSDEDLYGPSSKRVKQEHNPEHVTRMDGSLAARAASPLPVDMPGHGEDSKAHGYRVESSQTPHTGAEIPPLHPEAIRTTEEASEVSPPGAAAASETKRDPATEQSIPPPPPPADPHGATVSGWNKGVQSGLRTSFGNRPVPAQANVKVRGPGSGDGDPQRTEDTKPVSSDASRSSSGTDDQENPVSRSGGSATPQGPESKHKDKFQPLSKAAIRKLQPDEREAYTKAKTADKAQRKEDMFQTKTAEAELAIAQEGRWPLTEKYHDISKLINSGETFYPQLDREYKPFKHHSITFDTQCIFDDKGIPIVAQNFSFNLFAPAFLKTNSEKLRSLRLKEIRLAFYHYCNLWYCHVGRHLQPLLATAKAGGAFTFEQVIEHAGLSSARTSSHQTSTRDGLSNAASKSPAELGKDQAHLPGSPTVEIQDRGTQIASGAASTASNQDVEDMEFKAPELELELERELQLKYFPSANTELAFLRCLACGDAGHRIQACLALSCTLCGENGKHSNFTCPSKLRCGKCRQRGHHALNCPEKLFATRAEAGGCDICGSANHSEYACHFIWRSFAPQQEETRRVCNIPVYCYTCGASGHYGPECGLHRISLLSGGYTWSKSNLKKYVDPASQDRALSAGVDYSIPKPREFSIKGKGRASDPFTIEDSDDENDFIRPRIEKPGPRSHIHFAGRPRAENPALDNAPSGPRTRSNFQRDNLSYNVAMDNAVSGNYHPPNGYTPNAPIAEGSREASGPFRLNGNQRDLGSSNGNGKHSGAKKRKMRNQGGNQPGHASNNSNGPPPLKPKNKSGAKKRAKAAKNTR